MSREHYKIRGMLSHKVKNRGSRLFVEHRDLFDPEACFQDVAFGTSFRQHTPTLQHPGDSGELCPVQFLNLTHHVQKVKFMRGCERKLQCMRKGNLAAGREEAALYKQLATLRTDVPLTEDLEDLRWRGARRKPLAELCKELGDSRLQDQVPQWRD